MIITSAFLVKDLFHVTEQSNSTGSNKAFLWNGRWDVNLSILHKQNHAKWQLDPILNFQPVYKALKSLKTFWRQLSCLLNTTVGKYYKKCLSVSRISSTRIIIFSIEKCKVYLTNDQESCAVIAQILFALAILTLKRKDPPNM